MSVYKNPDSGTWYSICRFTDWKGVRKQKCRRGFTTKREALEWEREFLMQRQADVDMTFGAQLWHVATVGGQLLCRLCGRRIGSYRFESALQFFRHQRQTA